MAKLHPELDIEVWILEHPESIGAVRWLARQLRLERGKIDLLGEDANGDWMLIELKAMGESGKAPFQVLAYAQDLEKIRQRMYPEGGPAIRKIVISEAMLDYMHVNFAEALGVEIYHYRKEQAIGVYEPTVTRRRGMRKDDETVEQLISSAIERIREGYQPARVGEGA